MNIYVHIITQKIFNKTYKLKKNKLKDDYENNKENFKVYK